VTIGQAWLALILAHELPLGQDVALHGGKHLGFGAAAFQAEQSVGCQQPTRRSLRLCVSRRAIDNPRIDSLF